MSLVAGSKRYVLLCFLLASFTKCAMSFVVGQNPEWNYDQNGEDWTMPDCSNKTYDQSPYKLETGARDWSAQCDISFLTAWKSAVITSDKYGSSNYVFRINATDGNLGAWYATEPYATSQQLYWEVLQVRFHYPAEHTIEGKKFDLEMQITLEDTRKLAIRCDSHLAAFSLFFNVGDTEDTEFWAWTDKAVAGQNFTFDLNPIFNSNSAIQSQMWGYRGTDSEPNCTPHFCWYANYPQQSITKATLDKLKVDGVDFNNRKLDLGAAPIFRYMNTGLLYTPPTTDAPNTDL